MHPQTGLFPGGEWQSWNAELRRSSQSSSFPGNISKPSRQHIGKLHFFFTFNPPQETSLPIFHTEGVVKHLKPHLKKNNNCLVLLHLGTIFVIFTTEVTICC